ncbi:MULTISPECIES: amidohydrolase family protein [unclassified Amycolatopsis]|uniref:amidohydrolase n=1 Tax=unclassified Amycolatopsis TaxID=2618356 RepID=UPI002876E2C8|nr:MULTISPECIES: amidohydrolase family protein [unclassified Amycolatopsis]MDS0135982.1 amidohydrolase family protein [Amycolatopsis sp. 505]MDS0145429.1 amidohydrolase family protein [Amycolatopsis sp. CM201R]
MTAQRIHPADLVVRGGVVHTFGSAGTVTGLAVRGGRIAAAGGDLTGHIGPDTEVVDLAGRTVLPGINDAHLHATWLGARWPHPLLGAPHEETPVVTAEDRRAAILRAGDVCAALGITSYTEPGLGPGETGCFSAEVVDEYAVLQREGRLRARVTVLRLFGLLDGASSLPDFARGLVTPVPAADPEWLAVTGVKIFADGIPPMRTAWTHHCYADGTHGTLLVDGPDDDRRAANLAAMISLAHEAGLVVGVHATGERSIETALEHLRAGDHLVHGDLVTPAQLRRMAAHRVGLTTQPAIATAMRPMVATALGEDVAAKAWPLQDVLDAGVQLTLSSDAPVVTPDWRVHLAAAGELLGARGATPELTERLLRCYTSEAAAQDGSAAWKGSLEPGKVADFCVLAANPMAVALADLPSVAVELTVTGGRIVHKG